MSWSFRHDELQAKASKLERSVRLVDKNTSRLMKVIAWFLFIVSCGRWKREDFMKNTAVSLLHWIFIPREWDYQAALDVLPHECQHAKQQRYMGLGIHPIGGIPVAAITYGLFPLPVFCAFGRAWMEINADQAKWKYGLQNGTMNEAEILTDAIERAEYLSSKTYLWALWYSFAEKWALWAAKRVINGKATFLG
jgi:hypothetical protein